MSKLKNRVAHALALIFILPFVAGIVHAAEPERPVKEQMTAPPADKPPPTIDTDQDGKADAWDRDKNGVPDAWDVNADGKPDLFDDNGDGKPDDPKTPPPATEEPDKPLLQ